MVFAGTHDGPYRSIDRGDTWEKCGFPDRNMQVWSILVHPSKPQTVFVGTSPLGVYRSDDGGDNFRLLSKPDMPARCEMGFAPRVMRLAIDPQNPDAIYAPMEVNGVMRSSDGGETWQDCSANLVKLAERPGLKSALVSGKESEGMLDVHALCVTPAAPGTLYIALRMGLFRSDDRGETWADMEIKRFSPFSYGRDVRVSPQDPRVLYACLSVGRSAYRLAVALGRCRQDLAALRSRRDRARHDDEFGASSARSRSGLRHRPRRPGVRHARWRQELARISPAGGRQPRLLHDRLRLTRRA